jgi:dTDP-4-amino-4,6-dideoxygalactose transaminase
MVYYKGKPIGNLGHLAALSFHETKNTVTPFLNRRFALDDRK